MKHNLSYYHAAFVKLILLKGLAYFPLCILVFFLFFSSVFSAQVKKDSIKIQPIISVKDGAYIYSLDESFNKQTLNKNFVVDGKTTVKTNDKDQTSVIINSDPQIVNVKIDIKEAVEKTEEKKRKESLKKIKKHLDSIDQKKVKQVLLYPTSDKSFAGNSISHDHLIISFNNNDHKELGWYPSVFASHTFLEFSDDIKINYFNTQSLGYSIIGHFSVRPPPVV